LPESFTVGDIAKNILMIMLQDFMDPWTFNQKNLMKCCKEFLLPGGKQIPFCAYNTVGYREQARVQLEAMEPKRKEARRLGDKYEPRPVLFDMKANAVGGKTAQLHEIEPVQQL
jgi:7,8-dihydro-6-hydroxymethylpterin dimethyltransferase